MRQKIIWHEGLMEEIICYCFHNTRSDIEKDIRQNGHSVIMEKIVREKQFGNCQCSALNPKGR